MFFLSFFWVIKTNWFWSLVLDFVSEWKKNVSLLLQKNNNFFFLSLFVLFWFRPKWKKQISLLLGFIKRRKNNNSNFLYLFVLFFFSVNNDNWWQVGRWYGIPNLVMTWWLRWMVVTKLSKCWWRHIEMVRSLSDKKLKASKLQRTSWKLEPIPLTKHFLRSSFEISICRL